MSLSVYILIEAGHDKSVFPSVATGSGAASNALTLPVSPATILGTATVFSPSYPFVRVFPVVISGTTTIATPTPIGATLPTPDVIAGTTSIPTPIIGTLVIVSLVSGVATVGTPIIVRDATPETITGIAIIVTPAIHVTGDDTPTPTTPRWSLRDPETGVIYEFDINPSAEDYQPYSKQISYQNTLPGKSIIYEVTRDATTISWSGTIILQGHLAALQTWFDLGSAVELTDDLGRVFSIFITDFEPKRVRNATQPWLHTYDMKALVLT